MNIKVNTLVPLTLLLQGCEMQNNPQYIEQKYTNHVSKFVYINGKRVHYRDEGEGDVVVLLHGTSSSLHAWEEWAQTLRQEYRVIRMDLPGFGLTGHLPLNQYEIVNDIDFLNAFTKTLNISQAHFVGSSLGGRIAWEYSLQYPRQVQSLTLISALGYPQESWPPSIHLAKQPITGKIMEYITPKFMFENGLKEIYFDPKHIDAALVDRYYDLTTYKSNRSGFTRRVKASLDEDSRKIANISVPTLILWGQEDRYFPVENAYKFRRDIEKSTIVVYDNVGHLPMEEEPELSVKEFMRFISNKLN